MTNDEMRDAWNEARRWVVDHQMAMTGLELPSYFDDPTCCPDQDLRILTEGYIQWCKVEIDVAERTAHGFTDGWDDMSEDGYVTYLTCMECDTVWAVPDETDWS